MSEWLKLHHDVFDHPKTKRMAKILKMPAPHVVGHLASLWAFTARYATDGDLTDLKDDEIEVGAGWEGKDGAFVQAAVTVGYLDSDGDAVCIHDWEDYGGKWADRRARNAERMRRARAGGVHSTDDARATHVQRTGDARAGLEELRGDNKDLSAAKLAAASESDWNSRAETVLSATHFPQEYRDLADIMAAANKTGKVSVRRVVTALYEPLLTCENNGVGTTAFEYGLRAAIAKGAANVNYVKQAAGNYDPTRVRVEPKVRKAEYCPNDGVEMVADGDGSGNTHCPVCSS
jgi:hypothetical protein